jgi:hypothetical protein
MHNAKRDALGLRRVVTRIIIGHQRTAKALEHAPRMFARAAGMSCQGVVFCGVRRSCFIAQALWSPPDLLTHASQGWLRRNDRLMPK